MEKHFVTFLSPGTFVAEQTSIEIDSWDIDSARKMAQGIVERYDATPYGFCFTTRRRGPDDLDSHETARSGTYFLHGRIHTKAEVMARSLPDEDILRSNMNGNGYEGVVMGVAGRYSFCFPFRDGDVLLPDPTNVADSPGRSSSSDSCGIGSEGSPTHESRQLSTE